MTDHLQQKAEEQLTRREIVLLKSGLRDVASGRVKSFARVKQEIETEFAVDQKLQDRAEELVRQGVSGRPFRVKHSSKQVRLTRAYKYTLLGLTAGIAMAAPTAKQIDHLRKYVHYFGPMHVWGCPMDDTCDCAYKPTNDAINDLCRTSLKWPPEGCYCNEEIGTCDACKAALAKGAPPNG